MNPMMGRIFAISYQLVRTEFDPINQGSDSFSREINKKHSSGAKPAFPRPQNWMKGTPLRLTPSLPEFLVVTMKPSLIFQ
jgi:hypothetical protein